MSYRSPHPFRISGIYDIRGQRFLTNREIMDVLGFRDAVPPDRPPKDTPASIASQKAKAVTDQILAYLRNREASSHDIALAVGISQKSALKNLRKLGDKVKKRSLRPPPSMKNVILYSINTNTESDPNAETQQAN